MIRSFTVTNPQGESLTLELVRPDLSGFQVKLIDGLGPVDATINFSDFGSGDGAMYNSSRVGTRNIVLTLGFMEKPTIEATRHLSNKYFPNKKNVHIVIVTDERTVVTDGYVEKNNPDIFSSEEGCQISIICPSANLKALDNQIANPIPTGLMVNPTFSVATAPWTVLLANGGFSNIALGTVSGYAGPTFLRSTVTTVGTNGNGFKSPLTQVKPSTTYTMSVYVRLSVANHVGIFVDAYINGIKRTQLLSAGGTSVSANVWTRISVTFTTTAVDDGVMFSIYTDTIGSGSVMPLGSTFDIDAAMCEPGAVLNPYTPFYGDSSSMRRNQMLNSTFKVDTTGWSTWSATGVSTFARVLTGGVDNGPFGRATWTTNPTDGSGAINMAIASVECGTQYVSSVYVRPSKLMKMYLSVSWAYNGAATTSMVSAITICQPNVWTRLSVTGVCPVGSNQRNVQIVVPAGSGYDITLNSYIDVDMAVFEKGSTVQAFIENATLSANYSGEVETGAIFRIKATGVATNLTIKKVDTGETLVIDTVNNWRRLVGPDTWDTLYPGDELVISTIAGQKSITLYRLVYGMTFNVITSLTRASIWPTVARGSDTFELSADTGLDGLLFSVEMPVIYEGV